jgi:photosystem II stability/assembly factor-like uncharacterized protein
MRIAPAMGLSIVLGLAAALGSVSPAVAVKLELDTPALMTPLGLQRPLVGIAQAGARLVTVGRMGGIYYSDDAGGRWTQAKVPLSVDLTSAYFATPRRGWATGHDGIVLRTTDGGASWVRVLDGRKAARLMLAYYRKRQAAGDAGVATAAEESRRFVEEDGARPFLDVHFEDERRGYVVGAWGLILRTEDGGDSWEPWMHGTDNPDSLHLNAIRRIGDRLWIVGERGLMLCLDEASGRFVAVPSPNTGTWFGIAGAGRTLLAFGLQGRAFRSADAGDSWQPVNLPTQGVIAAGDVSASGLAVLGDSTGRLWISQDGGQSFSVIDNGRATPIFGLRLLSQGNALLVGMTGASLQRLSSPH